eukprot:COSAG04_NODE_8177_length_1011_cov_1.479167_2_plen_119_part_00
MLVDVEGSDGVVDSAALLAEVEAGRLWAAIERPGEEGMPTVAFRAEMALPNLELTGALASGFDLFPLGAQVLSRLPDSAFLYQSGSYCVLGPAVRRRSVCFPGRVRARDRYCFLVGTC